MVVIQLQLCVFDDNNHTNLRSFFALEASGGFTFIAVKDQP